VVTNYAFVVTNHEALIWVSRMWWLTTALKTSPSFWTWWWTTTKISKTAWWLYHLKNALFAATKFTSGGDFLPVKTIHPAVHHRLPNLSGGDYLPVKTSFPAVHHCLPNSLPAETLCQ